MLYADCRMYKADELFAENNSYCSMYVALSNGVDSRYSLRIDLSFLCCYVWDDVKLCYSLRGLIAYETCYYVDDTFLVWAAGSISNNIIINNSVIITDNITNCICDNNQDDQ